MQHLYKTLLLIAAVYMPSAWGASTGAGDPGEERQALKILSKQREPEVVETFKCNGIIVKRFACGGISITGPSSRIPDSLYLTPEMTYMQVKEELSVYGDVTYTDHRLSSK